MIVMGNNKIENCKSIAVAVSVLCCCGACTTGTKVQQERILFECKIDGNTEVFVINADGTGSVNLTNHPGYDGMPSWSGNGSAIIFVSDRDVGKEGGNDVYLMDADGSNIKRITSDSRGYAFP
jgi:Tol biopolymer transport system component